MYATGAGAQRPTTQPVSVEETRRTLAWLAWQEGKTLAQLIRELQGHNVEVQQTG